ncbi:hypothetical protein PLICRDRAFT_104721 [Plicaturopsis crispa FD-325 SS-3]|nr:hypothetical protein PLICRDRAFT_104721 [Plicaturopsis crispa FD-325 SS-3]
MLSIFSFIALVLAASTVASPLATRQGDADAAASRSCLSLRGSCNAAAADLSNYYNSTACILLTACTYPVEDPANVLVENDAPANQPRLTESAFNSISGGLPYITQQAFIDAYNYEISVTPNGTYPDSNDPLIADWAAIAAWTGDCSTLQISYDSLSDFFATSSLPGVCPAVLSCDPSVTSTYTCVPQPPTDNGSCGTVASECRLWIDQGLFQNVYCVMASMCYAEASTDVLLHNEYPTELGPIPTSASEAKLSLDVFNNITNGASTMSEQNVIDAYNSVLTGTWVDRGGPYGIENPVRTSSNGPYPTSSSYVSNFWSIISSWTGFCDTKEISYDALANYLNNAATSGVHPSAC